MMKDSAVYYSVLTVSMLVCIACSAWTFPFIKTFIITSGYATPLVKTNSAGGINTQNIDTVISQNQSVTELAITMDDKITRIPGSLGSLTNLTTLRIFGIPVSDIPPEIGNLASLNSLVIRHTNLTEIPPEIGQLQQLKLLDVSHNRISSIPEVVTGFPDLETLNVSYNSLAFLPSGIGNLTHLRVLDIRGNGLTAIPDGFASLKDLRRVYAGGNNFPEEIKLEMERTLPETTMYW